MTFNQVKQTFVSTISAPMQLLFGWSHNTFGNECCNLMTQTLTV